LVALGEKCTRTTRAKEIIDPYKPAGMKLTVLEMKDTGRAFPQTQYPAIRKWLRDVSQVSGGLATDPERPRNSSSGVVARPYRSSAVLPG
jgi:hypothetical protein